MKFPYYSTEFGDIELGNGVVLKFFSREDYYDFKRPLEKMKFKVNVSLEHFGEEVATKWFTTEIDDEAGIKKTEEDFIVSSIDRFKADNFDTILRLVNAFTPEATKVLERLMDKVESLESRVSCCEDND